MDSIAIEHLYNVEGYATFNIKVQSGNFLGESHFCVSKQNLNSFIDELLVMNGKLVGSGKIDDNDSDAYVKLEMQKLGKLIIWGQLGGSYEDQFLKFKLDSDQTILNYIIKSLRYV